MEQLEMEIMNIIVNAGDAKNHAYGAFNRNLSFIIKKARFRAFFYKEKILILV